jgi:hypothetical protein
MKRISLLILSQLFLASAMAQCSICTKTAGQIGQEAGKGFNAGIIYLAAMPFAIAGFIAFKWWQKERN